MTYQTATDWKPLERAAPDTSTKRSTITAVAKAQNITEAEAERAIDAHEAGSEYWIGNGYQVQVRRFPDVQAAHINIRRRDGKAIFRDWRHFQWIKNQLIGPECEAVELYPAESRLVDASNKYHLWCSTDPSFRFPLGMPDRDVDYTRGGDTNGTRQRAL
jgi:hypothetical protein